MRVLRSAKRRSAQRRYLISYCGIALIPVTIVVFALIFMVDANHVSTARDLYRRAIIQTSAHVDSIIQEMQGTAAHLTSNEYVQGLMDDPEQAGRLEDVISTYLTTVKESSRLPMQVAFYRVGETGIYTADGEKRYADFEASLAGDANLTMSQFFSTLNKISTMTTWLLDAGTEGESESIIAFTFSVSAPNTAKRGTLVFLVDVQEILSMINGYLGLQPDYLYLYAANYNLVGLFEKETQDQAMRSDILRSGVNTIENHVISGERYQVLRYKTDLFGLQIVTCVKLEKLYGNTSALHADVMGIALLITLASVVAAVLLARYAYRPIRGLLSAIDHQQVDDDLGEFERIDNHLHVVRSEMAAMQERLAMQRPMVRDRALISLMRGTLGENELELLKIVCPDIQPDRQTSYVALVTSEGKSLMHEHHLLEKLDLEGADAHGVYLEEERIFALLVVSLDESDRRREQGRQILSLLSGYGLPSLKVGIGNLARGYRAIPSSYLEAYAALNGRMGAVEGAEVYLYAPRQEPFLAGGEHWLLPGGENTGIYLQSLRSVDEKTALSMLDALLDHIQSSRTSLLITTYTRFDLFSKAMAVCEEEVVEAFRDQVTLIDIFSDRAAFHNLMTRLTIANCTAVEEHRNSAQRETRRRILGVVRARCYDPDFSLRELSREVDYSATYISRCLREETGYTFIQLVSMMRIARAKEELIATDDKIKEIVARVGYLDVASFTRKFKEAEGMTPGEYREMHRKKQE